MINLLTLNQDPVKSEAAFIASMNGLVGFTHQAARELNPHGIQVYAVETGDGVIERVFALLEEK